MIDSLNTTFSRDELEEIHGIILYASILDNMKLLRKN